MMVSRIAPYSGSNLSIRNRTNATNNIAFEARRPITFEDVAKVANTVLALDKYKIDLFDLEDAVKGNGFNLRVATPNVVSILYLYTKEGANHIRFKLPLLSNGKVDVASGLSKERLSNESSVFGTDLPLGSDIEKRRTLATIRKYLKSLLSPKASASSPQIAVLA